MITPKGLSYLGYQVAGIRGIKRFRGNCLLADEMGLGKTIQALGYIYQAPDKRPVLIVASEVLKWNWQSEAKKHFKLKTVVLSGTMPDASQLKGAEIVIINYDIIHAWAKVLRKFKPRVMILDETGSNLASPLSRRFRAVHYIKEGSKCPRVICLSGTPFENYPINLWPTLHLLKPDLFKSFFAYGMRYCKPRRFRGRWTFRGATRTKKLNKILTENLMIRRMKDDVLKDLPPKTRKVYPLDITTKQRKEYEFCRYRFLEWVKARHPTKLFKIKKAAGLVQLGYLCRIVAMMKREKVKQWIDQFQTTGKKLIVFTSSRGIIDWLRETYPENHVVIDGRFRGQIRHEMVVKFNNDPKTNFAFCNLKAGGVGLNMTGSSDVLFFDFPVTPGALKQGEDRAHRIGQIKPVTCHYMPVRNTVEEKLIDLLITKQDIINQVLNGNRTGRTDLDILSEIFDEKPKR